MYVTAMAWLWLFCCCVQCSLISCHAHTNVVLIVLTYVLFYCHVILCFIVLYVCWLNKISSDVFGFILLRHRSFHTHAACTLQKQSLQRAGNVFRTVNRKIFKNLCVP